MRTISILILMCLGGCGSRSGLDTSDGPPPTPPVDGSPPIPSVDAALPIPSVDAALHGEWWFVLFSGAIRFYGFAICDGGQAVLHTFLSRSELESEGPFFGRVERGPTLEEATLRFDPGAVPDGFAVMHVRYDRARDQMAWLEEDDVFPGWASGGGTHERPSGTPPDFELVCP